jgi:hypothetical protein
MKTRSVVWVLCVTFVTFFHACGGQPGTGEAGGGTALLGVGAGDYGTCAQDNYEPNDDYGWAAWVGFAQDTLITTMNHLSICGDDEDWFVVWLDPQESLEAIITFAGHLGDLDLFLYGPGDMLMDSSETTSSFEMVQARAQTFGWYVLRVIGYQGAQNDYSLELNRLPADGPDVPPGANRWDQHAIQILFNPDLDPDLDFPGSADFRWQGFKTAVEAWDAELKAIDPRFSLQPTLAGGFAGQQDLQQCLDVRDPLAPQPVWSGSFHPADGANMASAAEASRAGMHPLLNLPKVGWTTNSTEHIETDVDMEILAEFFPTSTDGRGHFQEGDILWHTHTGAGCDSWGQALCRPIEWDYLGGAWSYSFYSVMLHEVGHFLGLDHMDASAFQDNVMRSRLMPGQTLQITDDERAALRALYAR